MGHREKMLFAPHSFGGKFWVEYIETHCIAHTQNFGRNVDISYF